LPEDPDIAGARSRPVAHHRKVARYPSIPKYRIGRVLGAVPIGIQNPKTPLAVNPDLAGTRSRPIAHHRKVTRYAAVNIGFVDSWFINAISVVVQNPQESLAKVPYLRAAISVPVSDDWYVPRLDSDMQVEHRVTGVQLSVAVGVQDE